MVVLEQGPNIALVVDLYTLLLLLCMRVSAGLKHEPIDGGKDQELPDERHIFESALCAKVTVCSSTWRAQIGVDSRDAGKSIFR